jgi:hypothetical protein
MKQLLIKIAAVVLVGWGGVAVTKTTVSTLAYEVTFDIPW